MTSSVTDARTMVLVERMLRNGAAITSECSDSTYKITIRLNGDTSTGTGDTFPQAFTEAASGLP